MNTINQKALLARINRKLAQQGQRLRTARTTDADLGPYYIVDLVRNTVEASGIDDLQKLAGELGVRGAA